MQWFGAVKPDMPYTESGVTVYPSAGPYYIQSRDVGKSLVEVRNPYYKGSRPANPDKIVWTMNTDQDQSLLQVKAGQADVDVQGPPPTANASLASQYGVNKQRFHVGGTSCLQYWALNTSRAPFNSLKARQAVNWAIDRPALVRLAGKFGARRTDQILVPGMPGYKPYNLYAFRGANPNLAKKIDPLLAGHTAVIFYPNTQLHVNMAQVIAYDLEKIGMKTKDEPIPGSIYARTLGTRGVNMDIAWSGWCADYLDPFDYINVNLDGRSIQAQNNLNFAYLNNAKLNKAMDAAANLTGAARTKAYQTLDYQIMKNYAPWVHVRNQKRRLLHVDPHAQLRVLVVLRKAGLQRTLGRLATHAGLCSWARLRPEHSIHPPTTAGGTTRSISHYGLAAAAGPPRSTVPASGPRATAINEPPMVSFGEYAWGHEGKPRSPERAQTAQPSPLVPHRPHPLPLHTREVAGSIPAAPIQPLQPWENPHGS